MCVVWVRQWLNESVPAGRVLKESEKITKGLVISFHLTIGLLVICRGGHVVGLKQKTYSFKELSEKLRSIICHESFRYTVRLNKMLKKSVVDLRGCS